MGFLIVRWTIKCTVPPDLAWIMDSYSAGREVIEKH
jgi:hypothetical protein